MFPLNFFSAGLNSHFLVMELMRRRNEQRRRPRPLFRRADSTVCLAWALERFERVETVGFAYGQRHAVEMTPAPDYCSPLLRDDYPSWAPRLADDHVSTLASAWAISETALTRDSRDRNDGRGPAHRPSCRAAILLFFTYAAALGYRRGIHTLVGGMCETDFSGYPDCRSDTILALQNALSLGMDRPIRIETPLMWLDKAAIWALAHDLGGGTLVDLIVEHTHTCYLGDRTTRHAWGYGLRQLPGVRAAGEGLGGMATAAHEPHALFLSAKIPPSSRSTTLRRCSSSMVCACCVRRACSGCWRGIPNGTTRFAAIQTPIPQALYAHYGLDATRFDTFMVLAGGVPHIKWAGLLAAARTMPAPWSWLGTAGRIVPRFIGDLIYDWVQRNRLDWFGSRHDCMVPTAAQRRPIPFLGFAHDRPSTVAAFHPGDRYTKNSIGRGRLEHARSRPRFARLHRGQSLAKPRRVPGGRAEIVDFLTRKWMRELDYRLIKELWTFAATASPCASRMNGTTSVSSGTAPTATRTGSSTSTA